MIWVAQIIAALILIYPAYLKLTAAAIEIQLFTNLGMEPVGRYIIGMLELVASVLLVTKQRVTGAILGAGIMLGAMIAHITVLGIYPLSIVLLGFTAFLLCVLIVILRREEIPFFGKTMR